MAIIDAMKEVEVKKGDDIIKQGEDGDFFYVIDKGTYEVHVTREDGEDSIMQHRVKSAHVRRKLYGELIDKVSLFETLTEYEKLKIADVLYTLVFSDGESIIKQGETADGMYFVISGSVKITKIVDGKEVAVKDINSGQYFGELALLKNKPRAASATALGSTKVAFLAAEAFERLMGPCLKMMHIHADDYL
ncbi:hypothetical protein GE061_004308 [Apolygus lucorum]|uniref:Cyclic nucleotide-binding domain-containing protein n=1 Tax=Apolygus lucorum TaxID=248454 RepID=A0A8S9WYU3_APOLU|nr:hypothetical protein GE061_004308 [Apolygus lucorum]